MVEEKVCTRTIVPPEACVGINTQRFEMYYMQHTQTGDRAMLYGTVGTLREKCTKPFEAKLCWEI